MTCGRKASKADSWKKTAGNVIAANKQVIALLVVAATFYLISYLTSATKFIAIAHISSFIMNRF